MMTNRRGAAAAVDRAVHAVAGKQVVPAVSTPMVAITPQNMKDPASRPCIYDGTRTSSRRGSLVASDGD